MSTIAKRCLLFATIAFFGPLLQAYQRYGVEGVGTPFDEGMSNFEWYRPYWKEVDPGWALASALYTAYIVDDCQYQQEPRIPKIIHQIWIGSPLPDKYIPFIESWKQAHPDWLHILWTDDEIEELDLVNKDQYNASTNYGQKADIARYEILYRFGGVYIDIDFECLRPIDILNHCCDYYTGVAYSGRFSTFNGLIGAKPGSPIVKGCIDTLDITEYHEGTAENNILFTSGPFHQARNFVAHAFEEGRAVAFPVNYFYPWPFSKKSDTSNIEQWFRPESLAVHYWHASWRQDKEELSKEFSINRGLHLDRAYWADIVGFFPFLAHTIYHWFLYMW